MESNIAFYEAIRYEYDLKEDSIVYDLGAYDGTFARLIHEKYHCFVYAFEPIKEHYDQIPVNKKINKFNIAVGTKNETGKIFVDGASTSAFVGKGTREIVYQDINQVIAHENIDLFKINIEGGEFDLLRHMIKTGTIKICDNIQIQFHPFIKNAVVMRNELTELLKITHIKTWDFPFVWENWKRK